jgi:hypothetical protein
MMWKRMKKDELLSAVSIISTSNFAVIVSRALVKATVKISFELKLYIPSY